MRLIFISILLCFAVIGNSADRYWVGGNPSGAQWNQTGSGTTNWATSSGGAAGASVPGSSDNVFFDANGNSAATISATITVLSLTIDAGYTATMTHSAVLTIAGNVTFGANYTIAGASNITISAASTITSNGKTWPNGATFSGANTKTLVGNWVISGTLTVSGATTLNWTTAETLSCAGFTSSAATTGTAKIILTGGTWSGLSAIQNNMDIAGNVTVSSSVAFNTGTLTYLSGTVTTTGSTLTIAASTTLNTAGITWNNVTINASGLTITVNSLLSVTGVLTFNGQSTTFAGTAGFTVGTLTCAANAVGSLTLKNGLTYNITAAFNCKESRLSSIQTITSDHASNTAALNLSQGATCNVLANFTRITNSGRTIRTFNGTVTSCTGIVAFNDIGTNKH